MELNYQDHELMQNYINNYFKDKEKFIELVFSPFKCHHIETEKINIDNKKQIENIQFLFNYLIEKNILTNHWMINPNPQDQLIKVLQLFYEYFNKIKRPGIIMINNDLSFCNNTTDLNIIENYIQLFLNLKVRLIFNYQINFDNVSEDLNNIFYFISNYYVNVDLIINNNLENCIEYYKYWKELFYRYSIIKLPNFIIDDKVQYNEENFKQLKKLIKFKIHDFYARFDYSIERFTQFLLFSKEFKKNNNILDLPEQDHILRLYYYDKIKDNMMSCKLGQILTIDINTLSFPACCGLHYSSYNGGKLLENNKVEANDGINGFLIQKYSNINFILDCNTCKHKYFCDRICRACQFENSTEPFLPIANICEIKKTILKTLLQEYHHLGVFDYYFSQKLETIEKNYKYELIKLLKIEGYPEYEFRYSE